MPLGKFGKEKDTSLLSSFLSWDLCCLTPLLLFLYRRKIVGQLGVSETKKKYNRRKQKINYIDNTNRTLVYPL